MDQSVCRWQRAQGRLKRGCHLRVTQDFVPAMSVRTPTATDQGCFQGDTRFLGEKQIQGTS